MTDQEPAATDVSVSQEIHDNICGFRVLRNRFYYPDGLPYIGTDPTPKTITMVVVPENIFIPVTTGYRCLDCGHYTADIGHFGGCCKGVEDTQTILCPNCEMIHGARFAIAHLRTCYGRKKLDVHPW